MNDEDDTVGIAATYSATAGTTSDPYVPGEEGPWGC